jgi:Mrp family chromosome partitioning ATPase
VAEAGGAEPGKPPPVASLERALDQVCDFLNRAEQSARVRALVIEARRLRNAVGNWRSIAPDADVREEMIARVLRLANDAEDVVAAERPNEAPEESPASSAGTRHDAPTAAYQRRSLAIGLRLGPAQAPAPTSGAPTRKTPSPGAAVFLAGLAAGQDEQPTVPGSPADGGDKRPVSDRGGSPALPPAAEALALPPAREQTGAGSGTGRPIHLGATLSSHGFPGPGAAPDASTAGPAVQRGGFNRDPQTLQIDRVIAPPAHEIGVHEAPAQPPDASPLERALTATFASPPSLVLDRSALPQINAQPAPQPAPAPALLERSLTGAFPSPPSLVFDRSALTQARDASVRQPAPAPLERSLTGAFPSPPSLVFERVVQPPAQSRAAEVKLLSRTTDDAFDGPPSLFIERSQLPSEPDTMDPASEFGAAVRPDAITVRSLPLPAALEPRIVMVRDPYSPQADAYRTLRRKLSTITATTIAVTSASPREGKTTCAINLAFALRETSRGRILLVEANIRAPGIATTLQFEPPRCFTEQLQRHRDDRLTPWVVVEQAAPLPSVQPADERSESTSERSGSGTRFPEPRPSMLAPIHILAVDPRAERPPMLDTVSFSMGMESLKRAGYEYIIIDTPPVLGSMDMNVIGDSVDGVMLTSVVKMTNRGALRQAIERLRPAPVLGVVLLDY